MENKEIRGVRNEVKEAIGRGKEKELRVAIILAIKEYVLLTAHAENIRDGLGNTKAWENSMITCYEKTKNSAKLIDFMDGLYFMFLEKNSKDMTRQELNIFVSIEEKFRLMGGFE